MTRHAYGYAWIFGLALLMLLDVAGVREQDDARFRFSTGVGAAVAAPLAADPDGSGDHASETPCIPFGDVFTGDSPDAFDEPEAFVASVTSTIEGGTPEHKYYVAISESAYTAAGHTGCPWTLLDIDDDPTTPDACPFGKFDNDGRSITSPVDTFQRALELMHLAKMVTKSGRYTLHIRGGDFTYTEPIFVGTYHGYVAPLLYDSCENAVKIDSQDGTLVYKSVNEARWTDLGDNKYVVADITVQPFNNETVVLDGGCSFSQVETGSTAPVERDQDCDEAWADRSTDALKDAIYGGDDGGTFGMVTARYGFNVLIEGLTVQNSPSYGIVVIGGKATSNVLIAGNAVSSTYNPGIVVEGGSHYVVERNTISNTATSGRFGGMRLHVVKDVVISDNTVTQTVYDAAIAVGSDVQSVTFQGNHIYDNGYQGMYLNADYERHHKIRVDANVIYDNNYSNGSDCIRLASEHLADGAPFPLEEIVITNNICSNNYRGIWVSGYCQEAADPDRCADIGVGMKDVYIVNNTIWKNGKEEVDDDGTTTILGGQGLWISNPGARSVYVANNIFSENLKQQMHIQEIDQDELLLTHNIIYCEGEDEDPDGNLDCLQGYVDDLQLQVNPDLVCPTRGDFHLKNNSPAIDTGIWAAIELIDGSFTLRDIRAPTVDFENDERDVFIDIGADEYVAGKLVLYCP
jgi:hypothetical protein